MTIKNKKFQAMPLIFFLLGIITSSYASSPYDDCYSKVYDAKLCIQAREGFNDCFSKVYNAKLCVELCRETL